MHPEMQKDLSVLFAALLTGFKPGGERQNMQARIQKALKVNMKSMKMDNVFCIANSLIDAAETVSKPIIERKDNVIQFPGARR